MSLLVVGSIALDNIITPTEKKDDVLGGSASYFSFASSHFVNTRIVGVIGEDFPAIHRDLFKNNPMINDEGIQTSPLGTFRWTGEYKQNMNERETKSLELNAFGEFNPILPDSFKDSPYVFLANGSTSIQLQVLEQLSGKPKLTACDTMDIWINTEREQLDELLSRIDIISLNDSEAMLYANESNLIKAAKILLNAGPSVVLLKKGEHGVLIATKDKICALPAIPIDNVVDPTGAGDSFAGGFMGYLASTGDLSFNSIKKGAAYGTVIASITVQEFGADKLLLKTQDEIANQLENYIKMLSF